jgi:presenilin-like A22 family membrane protease
MLTVEEQRLLMAAAIVGGLLGIAIVRYVFRDRP